MSVTYLTAKDFCPDAESFTFEKEQEIERIKEYINRNWNKRGQKLHFSTFRKKGGKIHILVDVLPRYENLMKEHIEKWKEEHNWTVPIEVFPFDENDLCYKNPRYTGVKGPNGSKNRCWPF